MALVTRLMSGFYVDGICEVSAVYNDVTHILQEIVVIGVMDREVDVTVAGETVEIGRFNQEELRFNLASRQLRFFVASALDETKNETPRIVCTYHAQHLSRGDINGSRA